ncbi:MULTISPECIES: hypothetical protein [unclassified Ornithinimicrobium]|uniref:hypothetical protein n=1 Tax=unclassified Ornithinimicrobium TaxID=2615080 RepID=UPI0038523C3E
MRRALVTILAVPALLLAGCSSDDGADAPPPTTPPATDDVEPTSGPTPSSDSDSTTATADAGPTTDDTAATATPGDTADGEVEGGAEGEAAAQVATDFLVAMIGADPTACDHMVSFTDLERPMADVEADYEACVTLLPEVLKPELEAQGLDDADPGVLEAVTIQGADVAEDGTSAVVDEDNFTDLFAESMAGESIVLTKIEDRWYVDLDASFQTAEESR